MTQDPLGAREYCELCKSIHKPHVLLHNFDNIEESARRALLNRIRLVARMMHENKNKGSNEQ